MEDKILDDKKLSNASGGIGDDETQMFCDSCHYSEVWKDDYLFSLPYDSYYECPKCHKKTFKNITYKSLKDFK